ncbi:MAG TPA: MFS transporter [Thermoanaerobaculia bacterium]|nr:MFS transporter [Thermoanaerobaculia bacterium]HQN06027.1 MFS transporter [Thermoanaerobaculia bacterium]HQP85024.1 MFS transporter [Thermoanaerobaculia bacterium]
MSEPGATASGEAPRGTLSRVAAVVALSFSSGLPLGLVWIAIPDWMRSIGVDIRVVGLFTLAQAPWTFKFLWSPLMDRFRLPFWGRRRGWIAVAQAALALSGLGLAGVGDRPETPWVALALTLGVALAAATQDIAIDAYAVDVLRKEEHGVAVGLRTGMYRAAMTLSGGLSIWAAASLGWGAVNLLLGLVYLPLVLVTWRSPEPEEPVEAPRTLREAVWLPFLECLSRHRAVEILVFVVLYKLADALSQSLLRPFLIDMGYGEFDRGFVLGTAGVALTIAGTFLGGIACTRLGLGNALWAFGFLQVFSNIGYVLITYQPGGRAVMYGAMAFEMLTSGLGMGAFGVLLLRMTEKRFSATQYALFSSLFGLPRILGGPITGLIVDAAGWRTFFWFTIAAGVPGLLLLQRFAPLGTREPVFAVETAEPRRRMTGRQIARRAVVGAVVTLVVSGVWMIGLVAVKAYRKDPASGFDLAAAAAAFFQPATVGGWTQLVAVLVVGALGGLGTAALLTARHGEREADGATSGA